MTMDTAPRRFTDGSKTIELVDITEEANPRDNCDSASTLWCWHRRYRLGDGKDRPKEDEAPDLTRDEDVLVLRQLYLLDHSGLSISLSSFSWGWDSGRVGVGFVRKTKLIEIHGEDYAGTREEWVELATAALADEVKTYDDYLRGGAWGYREVGDEDNVIHGTFYGSDPHTNGLLVEAFGKGLVGVREMKAKRREWTYE